MSYEEFLIAPFQNGLEIDTAPWLAPEDSFSNIVNGHLSHGTLEKRDGYKLYGYPVHNNAKTITAITKASPIVITSTAHGFSDGNRIYIYGVNGMEEVNNQAFLVADSATNSFSLQDLDGNAIDSTDYTSYTSAGTIYLAPDDIRCLGIHQYVKPDGKKETLTFDQKRASVYDQSNNKFSPIDTSDIMSGGETDYVWAVNWTDTSNNTPRLYFTNGKAYTATVDGLMYYDGTSTTTRILPTVRTGVTLYGCKLVFAIKQRLITLHTFEHGSGGTLTHPQRARWCQAQNPGVWEDSIPGKGGYVDAPTGEQIISARQIQDYLLVFFTNSVWTLRPVSDPALPFRWDKINDFRACEAKMGTVSFDQNVISFGLRGITASDGSRTERIDDRIQNFVTNEINTDEFDKVFSARSFNNRKVWTLYPDLNEIDCNYALIFDEDSRAFSMYQISMNCLGYGVSQLGRDLKLDDFPDTDLEAEKKELPIILLDAGDEELSSYTWQGGGESFIGGTIDNVIYELETDSDDFGEPIDFTMTSSAWNPYIKQGKEAQFGYIDFYVDTNTTTKFTVDFSKDNYDSPYDSQNLDCIPELGIITNVVSIDQSNPAQVTAPGHGLSDGNEIYIYGVDGMDEINAGPYTVTVLNDNLITLDDIDSSTYTEYTTGGYLFERPFYRTKVWKRAFCGAVGYQHTIKITSNGIDTPFKVHAMRLGMRPRGKRTIG